MQPERPVSIAHSVKHGRWPTPSLVPILQALHTLTANFRCGKCVWRFLVFSSTLDASSLDRRRRMARVCLARRSRGRYFLFL
jgi:hypothetical protein